MNVQIGGNTVSLQVQSSGLGAALAINRDVADDVAAAAASAASASSSEGAAQTAQSAAEAAAAAAAATLAGAALKSANLSDMDSASTALSNLGGAAKSANLSDLSDAATARTNIGADLATNVNFVPATTTPATRSVQTKQREQPISTADSSAATTALKFLDAADSAMGANARVFIPAGTYSADVTAPTASSTMRGKPITIQGVQSGELFVTDSLQYGTLIQGVDATIPVWTIPHNAAQQGSGTVTFGMMRLSGAKNAGVPILKVEGLQGTNYIHDLAIRQTGAGDGILFGNITTSTVRDIGLLGATYPSGSGAAHTGVGVTITPDQDHALGWIHKITSRNFAQGYQVGQDTGTKLLGYTLSSCEVSTCTDGMYVGAQTEATLVQSLFVEATDGYCAKTKGDATLFSNPYCVLHFTTGLEFRGSAGMSVGGYIGLRNDGATGIVVGAESGGAFCLGTELIWGGAGLGGAGTGIKIEAQQNPEVFLIPKYTGSWTGGQKLDDDSYSSVHGGSGGGIGSGAVGILTRESGGLRNIPCLSRGSINLHYDSDTLVAADINGSGYLQMSNASVQELFLSASATTIIRFQAPNLPDKTGILVISNGYARIDPGTYIRGISVPLIFGAAERAVIHYQTIPNANGIIFITGVQREKTQQYTVATLPAAATAGAGYRAYVTDATAPTWGAVVAGGGAVKCWVNSDGTNWNVG